MKVLIIAAVFALVAGAASAQQLRIFGTPDRGYTVQTPGQLPTYVTPNPGGGSNPAGHRRTCARNKPRMEDDIQAAATITEG
jgi:hypothetical protein